MSIFKSVFRFAKARLKEPSSLLGIAAAVGAGPLAIPMVLDAVLGGAPSGGDIAALDPWQMILIGLLGVFAALKKDPGNTEE